MGAHVGETLLPPPPYNFTVYADLDHTNRDIETAEAFMRGARPDANFSVGTWDRTHAEYMRWLFNQGNSSTKGCGVSGDLPELVKAELGGNLTRVSLEQRGNIMRLNAALDCCAPAVCAIKPPPWATAAAVPSPQVAGGGGDECTLMGVPTYWEGRSHYWEDFRGPLSVASSLIEYVQLAYLNGLDWTRLVAGGGADRKSVV